MNRHERRRRARGDGRHRFVEMGMVDSAEALRRLRACGCPALVNRTAELTIVQHLHRHDCSQLGAAMERQRGAE
jgi:hypothetical protein